MLTDNELKLLNLNLAEQLVVIGRWWMPVQTPSLLSLRPARSSAGSGLTGYDDQLSALRYGRRELMVWLDHFELYAGSSVGAAFAPPNTATSYLLAQIEAARSFAWEWRPKANPVRASASQPAEAGGDEDSSADGASGEAGGDTSSAEGRWQLGDWPFEQREFRKPALTRAGVSANATGAGTTTDLTSACPEPACGVLAYQPGSSWSETYPALTLPLTPYITVRFGDGGTVLICGGDGPAEETTAQSAGDFGLEGRGGYYYRLASAEEQTLWQARREAVAVSQTQSEAGSYAHV